MSQELTIEEALSRAKKAAKQGRTDVAVQLFTAVLEQNPNHPVARKGLRKLRKSARTGAGAHSPGQDQVNALVDLYRAGRLEEVELSCRKLLATARDSVILLNILGSALQGQGKFEEAVKAFNDAIRSRPDFAEAHGNRGNALKGLGRLEDAIASYDKALLLKPDHAEAWYNRGNALKDHGLLEEAISSYEKAIEARPDFAQAHRNLSALKTFATGDSQLTLMEQLLAEPALDESARAEICFALAKAEDDLGECDKSFEYLAKGNRLRKKELDYDIDEDRSLFASIKDAAEDQSEDMTGANPAAVRPIFIVGMMRSGTSLVEQILASHGDVYGAGELETMNQLILPRLSSMDAAGVRAGYLEALAALDVAEKVVTDKMPLNFRWIGFILSAFPEAKIVHLERDPRAICWSIYKHYFPDEGNGYAYDMQDLAAYHALYKDLMSFWRERHAESIYDIRYDSLTENQEEETRKLLAFCGLEWQARVLEFHKTRRAVKTMSAAQVRSKMYQGSSDAWRKYERHLGPLLDGLGR